MSNIEELDLDQSMEVDEIEEFSEFESKEVEDDLDDLERLMGSVKRDWEDAERELAEQEVEEPRPIAKTIRRKELIDDFIRNFFIKWGLEKSLETFQGEWYEIAQRGKSEEDDKKIPDVQIRNLKLQEKYDQLNKELKQAKTVAERARNTWDELKRLKQNHIKQRNRVTKEKKMLTNDINELKKLHENYELKYQELQMKYQAAMKEKMLVKMDRDKLKTEIDAISGTIQDIERKLNVDKADEYDEDEENDVVSLSKVKRTSSKYEATDKAVKKAKRSKGAIMPKEDEQNPYLTTAFDPFPTKNVNLIKSHKAHVMPITALAVHPRKPFIATGSDDTTWKIWSIPSGEMIVQGRENEHKDWISDIQFSPTGTDLATSSGDSTVKVWNFVKLDCSMTFKDHVKPVWSICYHHTGNFLLTGSMDHSSKLLDLVVGKAVNTFRGHVDSVTQVRFLPFSNVFVTASADKTVSLWDARVGLCQQTFYGHLNCINSIDVNCRVGFI